MPSNPTCDFLTRELLTAGPWQRRPAPFAVVAVEGADAGDFLQRLCTQDVRSLGQGALLPAAFLDAKGKVRVTCLVGRGERGWWLEVQDHQQAPLLALLERFHFTEKLQFAVRPGSAVERVAAASDGGRLAVDERAGVLHVMFARRGVQFERWHGGAIAELSGRPLDADTAECLRMGAGLVRVGVDTEPTTLALEAQLDDHCSLTKGCYTGQEIVARIHTYGHTNRALVLLHLAGQGAIDSPQELCEPGDGIAVGRVMHAVPVPGRALRVGLGYLPRDFQASGTQLRLADGSAVTVVGFGD